MSTRLLRLFVPLILLAVTPAMAVDGQIPIPFGPGPVVTPIVITGAGSYVLTRNITATGAGPVISVAVGGAGVPPEDVQIDLNGHNLDQPVDPAAPVIDVVIVGGFHEAVIRNGTLTGGAAGVTVTGPARRITLEQLKISDFSGASPAGIFMVDVENFVIRDNVITDAIAGSGAAGIAIDVGAPRQGVISNNEIRRTEDGIRIVPGSFSVEISNNRLLEIGAGGIGAAIQLNGASNCLVSQNLISGLTAAGPLSGIDLKGSTGCKIYNNVIGDVPDYGILMPVGTDDNLVLNNVIHDASLDGLFVSGARNHIDRNVLNSNGGFGLRLGPGSFGNNVGRNSAVGNGGATLPACPAAGLWSPDLCEDPSFGFPPITGGPNWSFFDNLMPGGAGPI